MSSPTPELYRVPEMSCEHCENAITAEVTRVVGVQGVDIDLATNTVTVVGGDRADVIAAIDAAGYDVDEPAA